MQLKVTGFPIPARAPPAAAPPSSESAQRAAPAGPSARLVELGCEAFLHISLCARSWFPQWWPHPGHRGVLENPLVVNFTKSAQGLTRRTRRGEEDPAPKAL